MNQVEFYVGKKLFKEKKICRGYTVGGFGGRGKSQKLAMNLGLSNSFFKRKKQKVIRSNLGGRVIWGAQWGV